MRVVTVWWVIFNHPEFCPFGEPIRGGPHHRVEWQRTLGQLPVDW
jgi:hypothetical protein